MRSSLRRHAPTLLRNISRTSRAEVTAPRTLPAAPAPITRPTTRASQQQRWHTSSSVNADEISHFNALASTWWDPHGSSRALHLMNPLRHDFINACRSSSPSSSSTTSAEQEQEQQRLRYLDVGCGGGIFAESAARLPSTHSVTAIDAAPVIIQVARQHAAKDPLLTESKLRYINTTIENLSSTLTTTTASSPNKAEKSPPETQFDIVTLFEVIEHVDSPSTFLSHLSQHVKPGGWLILSTIARTWTSWFTTNFMAEDVLGIVPKGTHDWNKYINEDELRGYFAKVAGDQKWDLSSLRVQGVVYVPGLGWKEVGGSEKVGNYFLGIQKRL